MKTRIIRTPTHISCAILATACLRFCLAEVGFLLAELARSQISVGGD